jgi:hypothetical protein
MGGYFGNKSGQAHRHIIFDIYSVSSRISKGQGYQGFLTLRKRAGSSLGPKKGNLRRTMKNLKNGQISLLLGSINCFPIKF